MVTTKTHKVPPFYNEVGFITQHTGLDGLDYLASLKIMRK